MPGTLSVIATGLNVPWALAFLPGGDALVTERETGRILRVPAAGGSATEVIRIPDVATDTAEGGLLGVAVSATYATDGQVYAHYTTRTDNRIVRFKAGSAIQTILTGLRKGTIHNGGRIAFGPDGKLYAGVGETGDRGLAQDRSALNGKILRLNPDGSVPTDNPFSGSLVWSYGHRNVQGLAWDSAGRLWATEFGQDRFDEINLIRPDPRGRRRPGRYRLDHHVEPGRARQPALRRRPHPVSRGMTAREAGRHRLSPATRLMVSATMTVPNRYDSREWRSTVARNDRLFSSVSETWNVIPTVNAR